MMSLTLTTRSPSVRRWIVRSLGVLALLLWGTTDYARGQDSPFHLQRAVDTLSTATMDVSTETAHYTPIFGARAADAELAKGVRRYGRLTVDPNGASWAVAYGEEELVYYVLDGTGVLGYAGREVPISEDDFFYVPAGTDHRFANPREAPLNIMVMGFVVDDRPGTPTPRLQIANVRDVPSEVLSEGHGPTSHYQLLLGGTDSERDRIAAGRRVVSLYIVAFEPGGTNKVHRHPDAEEIYYLLQGHGEIVAGGPNGEPQRYDAEAGDAFFFTPDSPVGFFSETGNGEPRARILAVRSTVQGVR